MQIVHDILKPRFPDLTLGQLKNDLSDFEVIPVIRGKLIGAILRRGSELHALVIEAYRGKWFGKAELRLIRDTIKTFGHATTKVLNNHQMGHDFALRLGFEVQYKDDLMTYYEKGKS
jgi:GNAT superfamily N-acetyltransferase